MSSLTFGTLARVLQEELAKLYKLKDESMVRKVADWEYEKGRIADVLENIEEARVQFEVCELIVLHHLLSQATAIGVHWYQNVQESV